MLRAANVAPYCSSSNAFKKRSVDAQIFFLMRIMKSFSDNDTGLPPPTLTHPIR
jgi:hypothetical protein